VHQAVDRFEGFAERYAGFPPESPERLLRALAGAIVEEPPSAGGLVIDVGCGTGIFTRQMRPALPVGTSIVGIEPSSDMRCKAADTSDASGGVTYCDGLAEKPPIGTASARAVMAATAAHWFNRPAFYSESHRVLMPSGILAIVEHVRDEENSAAAAAAVDFLALGPPGPRNPAATILAGERIRPEVAPRLAVCSVRVTQRHGRDQ